MASPRVHFAVGLFMTAGLALATIAIIWLGMSSFLDRGALFVTYFDESVQGLNIDSPVKYRGVPVGRVKQIRIAPDYHLIEVLIIIEDEKISAGDKFKDSVASIANVGITGAMFVEIDRASVATPQLSPQLSFTPPYPVIASRPSHIRKILREIDLIATKIQSIDFQGISEQIITTIADFGANIEDAQIGAIAADIRTLLASVNTVASPERLENMVTNMDKTIRASRQFMEKTSSELARMDDILRRFHNILEANEPHIGATMSALASTTQKADTLMIQGTMTMSQMQTSLHELQNRIATTTDNLEQTSANLNALITSLKDQPSQLLFAQPKAPRAIEE